MHAYLYKEGLARVHAARYPPRYLYSLLQRFGQFRDRRGPRRRGGGRAVRDAVNLPLYFLFVYAFIYLFTAQITNLCGDPSARVERNNELSFVSRERMELSESVKN